MQRILKYHLLLDKLISETQPVSTVARTYVAVTTITVSMNSVSAEFQAHPKLGIY
jgi:hypothetical protein